MRHIFLLILLSVVLNGSAQKLNKYGKIVLDEIPKAPDYYRIKSDDANKILYKDSLTFDGNEFYKLPNAFIANDEIADNKPDKINYYNSEGKLVFSILTPRIINFKTSINGNYAAFYNQSSILLVNLNTIQIDTLYGSHSFAFTDNEELIYFDLEERLIAYKDQVYSCEEFPSMFLDFNSNILVFTSSKMMQLSGYDFITVRDFEGTFHDARIIDEELYIVEKMIKRKNVIYTLYKTKDLLNFEIIEKSDYK